MKLLLFLLWPLSELKLTDIGTSLDKSLLEACVKSYKESTIENNDSRAVPH